MKYTKHTGLLVNFAHYPKLEYERIVVCFLFSCASFIS